MKLRRAFSHCGIAAGLLLILASCSKSDRAKTPKEPPITGKGSDPAVAFKAVWESGKRYVIRMELTRGSESRRGNRGQSVQREDRLAQEVAVTVTNAAKGNLGIELELLALELEITQGDRTIIRYDPHNEVVATMGSPIAESLAKLIGGRIYYLVSSDNKVLKVEGMKEFMERAEGNATSSADSGRATQPRRPATIVRGFYNPDYFKPILDLSGLPDKPVRIGETWSAQREAGAGPAGALVANATYTFSGWQEHEQRKCARFEISGTLAQKTGNASARRGAASPIENSKVTGKCWFDPALGFPVETVIDQTYTMISAIVQPRPATNAPPQPRQGTNSPPQKVFSPVRQTLSIKLIEVTTL